MAVISKSHGAHSSYSGLGTAFLYVVMALVAIGIAVPAAIAVMG
ncbi:MAG: hypothetical protein U5J99_05630 [Parvularculaceae bacterium]|nr:hypothetical protein [Parvularculaceae bacterium]